MAVINLLIQQCIVLLIFLATVINSQDDTNMTKCIFMNTNKQNIKLGCGSKGSMYIMQAFYGQYNTKRTKDKVCVNNDSHCKEGIPKNMYDFNDKKYLLRKNVPINGSCTGRKYMFIQYQCIKDEISQSLCNETNGEQRPVLHLKNNDFPNFDRAIEGSCSCVIESQPQETIQIYSLTASEDSAASNFRITENGKTEYSSAMSNMPQFAKFQNGTLLYESNGPLVIVTVEQRKRSQRYRYYFSAKASSKTSLKLTCGQTEDIWKKYEILLSLQLSTSIVMPVTSSVMSQTSKELAVPVHSPSKPDLGLIIGSVLGSLLLLLLVVGAVIFKYMKQRTKTGDDNEVTAEKYEALDLSAVNQHQEITPNVYSQLDPATLLEPNPTYENMGDAQDSEHNTPHEISNSQDGNHGDAVPEEVHYEMVQY